MENDYSIIIERLAKIETKIDNFNGLQEIVNNSVNTQTRIVEQISTVYKETEENRKRIMELEKQNIILAEQNKTCDKEITEIKNKIEKINEKNSWAPKIAIGALITGFISIAISIFKNGLRL